jgi:predicted metal-dependent enzyme (double-stranded beta helix superfamily)
MSIFSAHIRRWGLSQTAVSMIAGILANAVDSSLVALQPGDVRRYAQLMATPDYDAWLIAWAPTAALDPHDHGGSRGAVQVIEGELWETYLDSYTDPAPVTHAVRAGEKLEIPPNRVHEVWNAGPAAAVSVHVYSPPLGTMEFFPKGALAPAE